MICINLAFLKTSKFCNFIVENNYLPKQLIVKKTSLFLFFLLALSPLTTYLSQEPATIRIKKESNLVKAVFDNTELRLMVVDRFGNPRENKIATYKLYVKGKRDTKEFKGYGNSLSPDMIKYLNKTTSASKLFFTELSASDDDGHLVKLPDVIDTWFPECSNCDSKKRR